MKRQGTILLVDDNRSVLASIELFLKHHVGRVITLQDPNQIPFLINSEDIDVVFLDMNFTAGINTGNEGIYWLNRILKENAGIVVVMITAYGDIELAVRAMREGAFDFIVKPWDNKKLLATIDAAMQFRNSRKEVTKLKNQKKLLQNDSGKHFRIFKGNSHSMEQIFDTVIKVSETDTNVLIKGENGTGKELIAREIHRLSGRSGEIFSAVDLGSISETLFESEMFGHVKGAFTDAKENRTGRFETASGGTLFLDEISNTSLPAQSKLLTAIEKKTIVRVGTNRETPVDIRLICATNKDINELVKRGLFREDLLYRINTVEITLPPLRERGEDIIILAGHFLKYFGEKYEKPGIRLGSPALHALESYSWPGNVRELKHTIERAVIMSNTEVISPAGLSLNEKMHLSAGRNLQPGKLSLEEGEKIIIMNALKSNRGNISDAARQLDIPRQRLYRKMTKYGLKPG